MPCTVAARKVRTAALSSGRRQTVIRRGRQPILNFPAHKGVAADTLSGVGNGDSPSCNLSVTIYSFHIRLLWEIRDSLRVCAVNKIICRGTKFRALRKWGAVVLVDPSSGCRRSFRGSLVPRVEAPVRGGIKIQWHAPALPTLRGGRSRSFREPTVSGRRRGRCVRGRLAPSGQTRGDETMGQDQEWGGWPEGLEASAPMSSGRAEALFHG